MTPTIGFVGMTHLGLNSAAASAARGFDTVCFDPDPAVIGDLNEGKLPIVEPGLPELLKQHGDHMAYTSEPADLTRCALVYIAALLESRRSFSSFSRETMGMPRTAPSSRPSRTSMTR